MSTISIAERLERGEIFPFHPCPFPLPTGDDLAFLLQQHLGGSSHKNISFDPASERVSGCTTESLEQVGRLKQLLSEFSTNVTGWLRTLIPAYATSWRLDRASLRPEEEAIRKLRLNARNDLLHFDAFPSRPTRGARILLCYVNINSTDERVWLSSDSFARVLEKYGAAAGLPTANTNNWVRRL